MGLHCIFDFLLSFSDSGLSHASLWVYLAAILAYHSPIEGFSVFSHPLSKRFLCGFLHLHPPIKTWDLPLVLRHLIQKPFEPLVSCDLKFLAWKTSFLVVITSMRRVSELLALRADPPCLCFLINGVRLVLDVSFLSKIISDIHLHLEIFLPDFYPSPVNDEQRLLHTLDVK